MVDQFPLGDDGAEWVCGASMRRIAKPALKPEFLAKVGKTPVLRLGSDKPELPDLFGALAELDKVKRSRSWATGRTLEELERARGELDRLRGQISAMESSKFWKLRRLLFRVLRAIGLSGQE